MPSPPQPTNARFPRLTRWTDLLLPIWFLGWTLVRLVQIGWNGSAWDLSFIGGDFTIYRRAAIAILEGGDPWSASSVWSWDVSLCRPAAGGSTVHAFRPDVRANRAD